MQITITAKIQILPDIAQSLQLQDTLSAVKKSLNYISDIVFSTKELSQPKLHKVTYEILRHDYDLKSQMAQSAMKTVIAKYKSAKSNNHEFNKVVFKKPQYDLVWNRDYSLVKGLFSVNTLGGRVKVPFKQDGMDQYFDGSWKFGTAKLVFKHDKFFLHIPTTKEVADSPIQDIKNVIGIDLGINFLATSYNSSNHTEFYRGRHIKHKRAKYSKSRKELQQRQTSSSRRRLRLIGQRENRWMTDVNHQVSKALVDSAGQNSLLVLEDLTGIRNATEKVQLKNRYVFVSWGFYQLRQMIEYKAVLNHSLTIAVDPRYTSQKCPQCGHTEKANRDKKNHIFTCKNCTYTSNDDRIGAMNLRNIGIEYVHAELVKQVP